MTPGHGPRPQKGKSPFGVKVMPAAGSKDELEVTLFGRNGENFKGFLLQVKVKFVVLR